MGPQDRFADRGGSRVPARDKRCEPRAREASLEELDPSRGETPPSSSNDHDVADQLQRPPTNEGPTSGTRGLDRQIESYLSSVERSLLEASIHEGQLEDALVTRTMIGQATGLLMGQEGLTSEEAFAKLVQVSQNANIKLREIAERYVEAWEEKVNRTQER